MNWKRLKSELGGWKNNWKKLSTDKIILLFAVGILLIIFSFPMDKNNRETVREIQTESQSINNQSLTDSYKASLETELSEILAQIKGVEQVRVMITMKSTAEEVPDKDLMTESSQDIQSPGESGENQSVSLRSEEDTVLVENNGNTSPYILKTNYPRVEGVLVVIGGEDTAGLKAEITEAVQALFHVSAHKIKVLKGEF